MGHVQRAGRKKNSAEVILCALPEAEPTGGKKYCAFMRFQGKIVLNKFFDTLGEASLAYREAEMKFREPILTKWAMEKNLKKQEENKNGKNDIWQLRNTGF